MKEKFLRTSPLTFFFVQRRRTALRRFFFADWKAESEGGNNQVNESSSRSISSYTLEAFTSEFMTDFHFQKALDFFSIRWSHGSSKQLLVLQQQQSVWKSQKKSHSTLRAKRATFTFWVDKSSSKIPKMVNFEIEACSQTVLPDRSILIRQKLVKNVKVQMRQFEWFSNTVSSFSCFIEPSLSQLIFHSAK